MMSWNPTVTFFYSKLQLLAVMMFGDNYGAVIKECKGTENEPQPIGGYSSRSSTRPARYEVKKRMSASGTRGEKCEERGSRGRGRPRSVSESRVLLSLGAGCTIDAKQVAIRRAVRYCVWRHQVLKPRGLFRTDVAQTDLLYTRCIKADNSCELYKMQGYGATHQSSMTRFKIWGLAAAWRGVWAYAMRAWCVRKPFQTCSARHKTIFSWELGNDGRKRPQDRQVFLNKAIVDRVCVGLKQNDQGPLRLFSLQFAVDRTQWRCEGLVSRNSTSHRLVDFDRRA